VLLTPCSSGGPGLLSLVLLLRTWSADAALPPHLPGQSCAAQGGSSIPNPTMVLVPKEGFTSELLGPCRLGTSLFFPLPKPQITEFDYGGSLIPGNSWAA